MRAYALGAIELACIPPDGVRSLERELLDAISGPPVTDIAGVARMVSMANAAISVSHMGIEGVAAPWFADIAKRLLKRTAEGLTMVEAQCERASAGLN